MYIDIRVTTQVHQGQLVERGMVVGEEARVDAELTPSRGQLVTMMASVVVEDRVCILKSEVSPNYLPVVVPVDDGGILLRDLTVMG